MGANIGRDVCLYPTGGDPMMTEPELVTINDEACVDNASLIAHLNVKGQFSLNQLWLGELATMRSNTRLLSGKTRLSALPSLTRQSISHNTHRYFAICIMPSDTTNATHPPTHRGLFLCAGASLGDRSRLLEHTLIYSGEFVDPGTTWQGYVVHRISPLQRRCGNGHVTRALFSTTK
jgi:hypothetical protein